MSADAKQRVNWSGVSLACFALAIYIAGLATGGFLEQYRSGAERAPIVEESEVENECGR